jgi:hypothetical protein
MGVLDIPVGEQTRSMKSMKRGIANARVALILTLVLRPVSLSISLDAGQIRSALFIVAGHSTFCTMPFFRSLSPKLLRESRSFRS